VDLATPTKRRKPAFPARFTPLQAHSLVWIGEDLDHSRRYPAAPIGTRFYPRAGRMDRRLSGSSVEKPCAS
jgi:hypothetical protein